MPGRDPTHWLHRLSADEWLAAAENELRSSQQSLARRAVRPAVTYARRAAGMALNAVMVREDKPGWGRSYWEHVLALIADESAPETVRAAALLLRDTPPLPPTLVRLGQPDLRVLEAARKIFDWSRERAAALKSVN